VCSPAPTKPNLIAKDVTTGFIRTTIKNAHSTAALSMKIRIIAA
jgi:hypothetical protein